MYGTHTWCNKRVGYRQIQDELSDEEDSGAYAGTRDDPPQISSSIKGTHCSILYRYTFVGKSSEAHVIDLTKGEILFS